MSKDAHHILAGILWVIQFFLLFLSTKVPNPSMQIYKDFSAMAFYLNCGFIALIIFGEFTR